MKYISTGLAAFALSLSSFAQPNCEQVIQAAFTASVQGSSVIYSNASQSQFPNSTAYVWYFGDGSSTADHNASHTYGEPGTYTVCLYATVENCVDTVCHEVTIGGDPCDVLTNASISLGSLEGGVSFSYNELPAYANTFWYFGDGTMSDAAQGFHPYQQPGTYTVCLWTWFIIEGTTDTCSREICQPITVAGQDPCAGLSAGFTSSAQGSSVQFTNTTSGAGFQTTWFWQFGDGTTGDGAQPSHLYAEPGTYLACLTAVSVYEQQGGGLITCADTVCHEVNVLGGGSPCDSLSAAFSYGSNGGDPQSIFYTASGLVGSGTHWLWSFGDGIYSDNGPQGTHAYPGPGSYELCLTVWQWIPGTQDTCSVTNCQSVVVGGTTPCDSLYACFQWGGNANTLQFYNCSNGNGNDLQYQWGFGDGTYSDAYQPSHTYPGPGTYTVCLVISAINSPDSCSDSICNTIVIQGDGSPCDSLSADFIFTSQENLTAFTSFGGTAIGYQWNFGDGTSGDGPNPMHAYPGPGSYHACLITWAWNPQTQDTCYADHCAWVTIGGSTPCDSLYACFQWGLQNNVAQFYNCSNGSGNDLQYQWSFGDGTYSDAYQPSHTYPGPGTYTVCLVINAINSPDSCSDSVCNTVVIQGDGSPCDSLSADFIFTTQENVAAFTSFGGTAYGYHWAFGDGTNGDGPNPTHTYPGPGAYHACLTTWTWNQLTQDTCYADHCAWVTIGGDTPCDSLLYACFQWGTPSQAVQFYNCSGSNGGDLSYWWSFGDGTHSDAYQPLHTYAEPGTYTVCLMVGFAAFPDSCTNTVCNTVVIQGSSPCDGLNAEFSFGLTGLQAALHAGANPPGTTYQWTFDGTNGGDGANTEHTFPGPGVYSVCLTVGNYDPLTQDSCFQDHCQQITVAGGNPCEGLLEAHFEYGHQGNVYTFYNTSSTQGVVVSTHWDFGDGSFGNDSQLTHTYAEGGEYTVCMTITGIAPGTNDTCQATICQTLDVVLGLRDDPSGSAWNAWPQPFDDLLQLDGGDLHGLTRFTLFDMTGRAVNDQTIAAHGRISLHYDQLPAGAYVLRMRSATMDRSIRVIKR